MKRQASDDIAMFIFDGRLLKVLLTWFVLSFLGNASPFTDKTIDEIFLRSIKSTRYFFIFMAIFIIASYIYALITENKEHKNEANKLDSTHSENKEQ